MFRRLRRRDTRLPKQPTASSHSSIKLNLIKEIRITGAWWRFSCYVFTKYGALIAIHRLCQKKLPDSDWVQAGCMTSWAPCGDAIDHGDINVPPVRISRGELHAGTPVAPPVNAVFTSPLVIS